jgi:hypothetical protein
MLIKILILLSSGILFRLGGAGHKWARRVIIPILLAGYLAIKLDCCLLFLYCGLGYSFVGLGYGSVDESDPGSWLGRIFRKAWITRGAYGGIVAGLGALGLVLGGFLPLFTYIGYVILNFGIGAYLAKIKARDIIIEPMVGIGISSIILFI